MLKNKIVSTLMDVLDESNPYLVLVMVYMALFVSGGVSMVVNMVLLTLLSFNFVVNLFFAKPK
ncbi:hypothetical protein D3C87_401860 [compost metagenome]